MTPFPVAPAPFTSGHSLARIAVVLFVAMGVVFLLFIPAEIGEVMLPELTPEQELGENPAALAVLLVEGLLGLILFALGVANIVVFLMWLYRCSKNLLAFGQRPSYSSGWAVGSFFVPFVNLVVPYLAVREVWQKSQPATEGSFSGTPSAPAFFPAWWFFWLTCNFATNISLQMTFRGAPREPTAVISVIGDILSIAAAGFAIMVVREIDRRQEEARQQLAASQTWPAPPPPPQFYPPGGSAGMPQQYGGQQAT